MTLPKAQLGLNQRDTNYPLSRLTGYDDVANVTINKPRDPSHLVAWALKSGLLKKTPCLFCKGRHQSRRLLAHHQDYAKPFDVIWVCYSHHRQLHNAMRANGGGPRNTHLDARKNSQPSKGPLTGDEVRANLVKARAAKATKALIKRTSLTSLLLVALLTPAPPRMVNSMFVLSEVARKRYAQFSLKFEPSVTGAESQTEVTSVLEPAALPAVLAQIAKKHQDFTDRVLARLSEAEREEVNTHLQQDIRQAWITVSYAQRMSDAFVMASYAIYGKHPDQIWPSIVADRKERLGAEYYEWYSSDDLPRPDVPKIPPTTANADTHAAHGAGLPTGTGAGSVPNPRRTV